MENGREKGLVSVVIPTWNREALLERAVRSALAQEGPERIEVLIMDDGSTDGTEERIRGLGDPRIRYFRLEHGGACAARNRGAEEARGEYIAFLDSDDTWRPEKARIQLEALERTGADAAACALIHHEEDTGIEFVFPDTVTPEGWVDWRKLLPRNLISTQTILGRAESLKKIQFDLDMPRMQDWDYVIRLARDFRVYYLPEPLVDVYVQSDSISRKPELAVRAMRRLIWKYREGYLESEESLNRVMDDLIRYAIQAENSEAHEKNERIARMEAELRQTGIERDYYLRRWQAVKNPIRGLRILMEKRLRRGAKVDK